MENKTDILVVGAGLSGVSAAIAAARNGARVILLENENHPGGTFSGLKHHLLCGLFLNSKETPTSYLNSGISQEIASRISSGKKPVKMGLVWVLPIDPVLMIRELKTFFQKEKNISVFYGSKVHSCKINKGKLTGVIYINYGKKHILTADGFIDASGGILSQLAHSALPVPAKSRQYAGYTFEVSGVSWDDFLPIKVPYILYQAAQNNEIPSFLRWSQITLVDHSKGLVQIKLSVPETNTITLAKQLPKKVLKLLKQQDPKTFHNANICWHAQQVYSRNGVTIDGQYFLKDTDVLSGQKFPDAIAKGAWPTEFWDQKKGVAYRYPQKPFYEIPLRSLKSSRFHNLLAAGRCICAESQAQASLRVGGICMATGEAAGIAATELITKKQT